MTLAAPLERDAVATAAAVAGRFAAAVDGENRFPAEAVDELRRQGLLGLLVPASAGGMGGRLADACEIASALGAECLSTGLIWAMHSQQVAIMADHAADQWGEVLADVAGGALVASATTEPGKSGTLRFAHAPLHLDGDEVHVDRPSPVVSYGAEADYHLVTMRGGPSSAETDVRYLLLSREDGCVTGDWSAMGMRGTRSVPMRFEASVPLDRVLAKDFRHVAATTAIPAAHLGWTSAWYGAARGALEGFVALLREGGARDHRRMASDLFTTRLGDIRLRLDLLDSMLSRLVDRYEAMRAANAPAEAYEQPDWTIALNGLKVAGSRISHETVDSLITVAGLARGYLRGDALALERRFRDLRSASLMVNNDELLQLNARRMLLDAPTST
ncbi:MAG: acyl-CoA/acyl-ACP dehydrogenase [Actinomycetota bacterium]|nr:acyl-CoA/acyl-ACP dehydrogenase [Actinomycetota bacterium]